MKYLFFNILFLITIISFAQEPIYNNTIYTSIYFNERYSVESEGHLINSLEYYNKNKVFNTTSLQYKQLVSNNLVAALNAEYNYLGTDNNIAEINGIIEYEYETINPSIFLYVKAGVINNNISYSSLQSRYTFKEQTTSSNISFNKQLLNIGFGASLVYESLDLGFDINHINQPKLPLDGDKVPIKYSAYIRKNISKRFISKVNYMYQDEFFFNPVEMDYYYSMLNYFGANINYQVFGPDINLGLGYKYLSNYNNMYSINVSYHLENFGKHFDIGYAFSILDDKYSKQTALFHQVGISYYYTRRMGVIQGL